MVNVPDIGNGVHLWSASLDLPADQVAQLRSLLSAEECDRMKRYRFERDRRRFLVRRGVLRVLLGQYLNIAPGDVSLLTQEHGKPVLAQGDFAFNLSHSDELAVFALARHKIGVDVERVRPIVRFLRIAQAFTDREQEFIASQLEAEQLRAFFACWTCKEACLKALGVGLGMSLQSFDVTEALLASQATIPMRLTDGTRRDLRLIVVTGWPDYALAVATEAPCDGVAFYNVDGLN